MQSGMLVVNKEAGYTSSDVVAKLRGILKMKKIGHTGTLDPAAEGVLPVCIGYATRLCDMIAAGEKEYEAVLHLGVVTDTQDMTGEKQKELPPQACMELLTHAAAMHGTSVEAYILQTMGQFVGTIWQTPPKYSAIWVHGKRAYNLARAGVDFEIPRRQIQIFSIHVSKIEFPLVTFTVGCSSGTYIRTLCEDIGNALGCGGAMEHLRRIRVGDFTLEHALTLGEIESLVHNQPGKLEADYLYPTDYFFRHDPAVYVTTAAMPYLRNGNPLSQNNLQPDGSLQEKIFSSYQTVSYTPTSPILSKARASQGGQTSGKSGSFPGGESQYVRVYGDDGAFYGIYQYNLARRRLVCVKMFHEVDAAKKS